MELGHLLLVLLQTADMEYLLVVDGVQENLVAEMVATKWIQQAINGTMEMGRL